MGSPRVSSDIARSRSTPGPSQPAATTNSSERSTASKSRASTALTALSRPSFASPPGGRSIPLFQSGCLPLELVARLDADRLLPLEAKRVHRVGEVDAFLGRELLDDFHAAIEVGVQRTHQRPIRQRLNELGYTLKQVKKVNR